MVFFVIALFLINFQAQISFFMKTNCSKIFQLVFYFGEYYEKSFKIIVLTIILF